MRTKETETVGEYVAPMTKILAVNPHSVLCSSTEENSTQEYDRVDTDDWF